MRAYIYITAAALLLGGCAGGGDEEAKDRDFATSGSRDADQRAEQRISKTQQMRGEGAKEGGINKNANTKASLYDRLGGEKGLTLIVDDWIPRVLADPRVNWERKGIKRGGVLGVGGKEQVWTPDPTRVAHLKKHLIQFFSTASGGPAKYEGRDMKQSHDGMKITNPEFDAAVGDMKATLDHLRVPTEEQKELLAIIETTREQIAEKR
jgi:hemoglobin